MLRYRTLTTARQKNCTKSRSRYHLNDAGEFFGPVGVSFHFNNEGRARLMNRPPLRVKQKEICDYIFARKGCLRRKLGKRVIRCHERSCNGL
jgi:hypothetical protein